MILEIIVFFGERAPMSLRKLIKKSLLVLGTGVVLTTVVPVRGIAQDNINTPGNIFSQWVKLSLMGYNQSEIEATLNVYQTEEIQLVKRRLRRNVLNNLVGGNLKQDISLSTTEQELRYIRDKIRTEIRFAGLENDFLVRQMIRHQFGIAVQDI
jgi:hypothetical protein